MRPIFHPSRQQRGIARVFRCHSGRRLRAWITVVTFGAATGGVLSRADAQGHGPVVGDSCTGPICTGENLSSKLSIGNADGFGDSIMIEEVWDVVFAAAGEIRFPASGNLPIVAVFGNTNCTVGGALPCQVCAANSLACGVTDPMVRANPGLVAFVQDQYVAQAGDPRVLSDQMNVIWRDLCDCPNSIGGATLSNLHQWACGAQIRDCNDGNPCTIDSCSAGVCEHAPMGCDSDGVCDSCEDCSTCPEDCIGGSAGCGNGVCEPILNENCLNCPEDCNGKMDGKGSARFCCGAPSGKASGGCDDARCTGRGFACSTVPADFCCGDGVCEGPGEDSCNCALDCGSPPDHEVRGTSCADGIDNDCDGLADAGDPDCLCGRRGILCTSGADCCSNNCSQRGVCR